MSDIIDFIKEIFGLFLQGFCVSVVRPGIVIFLLLILTGKLGRGIGLPLLFWRPQEKSSQAEPRKTRPACVQQFMVGIGVGALLWQVLLAGYLFEEFATNYTYDRSPFCEVHRGEFRADELEIHTKVDSMPSVTILGIQLDFPAVDENFTGRFRYDPLDWTSLWLYAIRVLLGGVLVLLGAGLLIAILPLLSWFLRTFRRQSWTPFRLPSKQSPLPISFWLPAGMVVGALAISVITWVSFQHPLTQKTGQVLTTIADWGTSDARKAVVQWRIDREKKPVAVSALTSSLFVGVRYELPQPSREVKNSEKNSWSVVASSLFYGVRYEVPRPIREEKSAEAKAWFAPYYPVYGAFVWNFVLIFTASMFMIVTPQSFRFFSPAVGIVLLLHLLLATSTILTYFSPLPADFIVIVIVAIVILSGRSYKLKFPHLGHLYREPIDLMAFYEERAEDEAQQIRELAESNRKARQETPNPTEPAPLPVETGGGTLREKWTLLPSESIPFGATHQGSGLPRLAIVCVSGGGSRAAAWTMKTLLEIEKAFADPKTFADSYLKTFPQFKNLTDTQAKAMRNRRDAIQSFSELPQVPFPYQIRLVTGASGGMIAGSYYVASLAEPKGPGVHRNHFEGKPLSGDQLFDGVCKDFLTPLTHTLFAFDLPSLLTPFHLGWHDRGTMLEKSWSQNLHGQLDLTFTKLWDGERDGWRPSLIFSPMTVEDGRQLFISNLELTRVVRNSAMILGETDPSGEPNPINPFDAGGHRLLSREGLEFFKVFPHANEFRLSTAARMSASFPYVLPAAYLPTNPPRRVVDAGYYDNYGVSIAASWLFSHRKWIVENTSGVVVIQIRDGISGSSRRREEVFDSFPSVPEAGLHWLTSPPTGIWQFRQAAQSFHNDNLLYLLNDAFEAMGKPSRFLSTINFEFPQGDDVALNFTLTEGERATIEDAVKEFEFQEQIRALLEWWHQPIST